MSENPSFRYLTVIGLGLIGGSLAMAARQCFPDLVIQGVDRRAEALQFALRHGVIDRASLTLPDTLEGDHLVVLACHLNQNLVLLESLSPLVQETPDVLVTDIGSCKRTIVELGRKSLPGQFIAAHPMAGKALSGIENATALLFAGKPFLLCPHAGTDVAALAKLEHFIRALGAQPRCIEAEQHDRYMAYVSHLPQVYAVLLANVLGGRQPEAMLTCHGGGIEEQLRLAASPYAMWGDILQQNRDNLAQALQDLKALIDEALSGLSLGTPIKENEKNNSIADEDPWRVRFENANRIAQLFQTLRSAGTQMPCS